MIVFIIAGFPTFPTFAHFEKHVQASGEWAFTLQSPIGHAQVALIGKGCRLFQTVFFLFYGLSFFPWQFVSLAVAQTGRLPTIPNDAATQIVEWQIKKSKLRHVCQRPLKNLSERSSVWNMDNFPNSELIGPVMLFCNIIVWKFVNFPILVTDEFWQFVCTYYISKQRQCLHSLTDHWIGYIVKKKFCHML